jgi:membrane protease YdiL (CAAX protease family)
MLVNGLISALIYSGLFLIVVCVRFLLNQEGLRAFGLQLDRRSLRLFAEGLLIGALAFALYPLLTVLGGYGELRVSTTPLALSFTLRFIPIWSLALLMMAIFEEALFRGYLLPKFLKRLPLAPAIILPALLFSLIHLLSHEPSPTFLIGVANAALFGVVMAIAVIQTRSLLWAIGCSLSWNLTQLFLLQYKYTAAPNLLNLWIDEGLMAGTAQVPESGLIMSVVTLALGALVVVRYGLPRSGAVELDPLPQTDQP